MARTNTKREAKVETVEAPVMQAPEQPTAVAEAHVVSEGEMIKYQAEVQDILDQVDALAAKIESAHVDIEEPKARETAQKHLAANVKALEDAHAKLETISKRFGWVKAALEKAANAIKRAKAKAEAAEKKAAEAKAKAEAKKASAK